MAEKKRWDLTSTHSLLAAAEWLRKSGGAQVVLVLRKDDWAEAHDPALSPLEVRDKVRDTLAPMLDVLLRGKAKQG
jgi:hypothetical protein